LYQGELLHSILVIGQGPGVWLQTLLVKGHADIMVTEVLAFSNYLVEDAKNHTLLFDSCLQFMVWSLLFADKVDSNSCRCGGAYCWKISFCLLIAPF
jgi:hypothetical protein